MKTYFFEMPNKDVEAILDVISIEMPADYNKQTRKAFARLVKELKRPAIVCNKNFPKG